MNLIPDDELIGDGFAGGGGASTGILMATGRHPDFAINHDPEAIAMHEANHPSTEHYCQTIYQVDPADVVAKHKKRIGLLWMSPDCTHHSKARGGKPKEKHIRDLAWIVPYWCERGTYNGLRPRVVAIENVEEFKDWGPLTAEGKACPDGKGKTFKAWCNKMRQLGYKVESRELRACDYGAPTIRKRLFIIARCDGLPIVWPKPTHGPAGSGLLPYRTAGECIDWTIPCPSIFLTKEEGRAIRVKRPLAPKTMKRLARGIKRFVIDAKEPFIVNLTHVGGDRNEATTEPFKTITGANRGEKALVAPCLVGAGGPAFSGKPTSANAPYKTIMKENHTALVGASLAPFVAGVGGRAGQSAERSVNKPYHTTTSKADTAVVAAHITKFRHESIGSDAGDPLHTITAGGKCERPAGAPHAMGVVEATLAPAPQFHCLDCVEDFYDAHASEIGGLAPAECPHCGAEGEGKIVAAKGVLTPVAPFLTEHANASNPRSWAADEPLRTQCAQVKGGHFALATPVIVRTAHGDVCKKGKKRGKGEHNAAEPLGTVTASGDYAVAAASLVQTGYGEREGQEPRALDPNKPLGTIVAGGGKFAAVAACLAQYNNHAGDDPHSGRNANDPMSTVTTSGSQQGLITANIVRHFGASVGSEVAEPVGTVVGKAKTSLVTSNLVKLRGDNTGQEAHDPLATVSAQGTHHAVATGSLVAYYGTDKDGSAYTDPMGTVTGNDRFGAMQAGITVLPLSEAQKDRARAVASLLREHDLWDDREFVTLDWGGSTWIIADIGLRMLKPHELYAAQGFPADYIIDPMINGKPLTATAQVRMCGNSVSPHPAAAIVRANCAPPKAKKTIIPKLAPLLDYAAMGQPTQHEIRA